MLAPKRVKHRKQHRPRPLKGLSKGHTQVYVGDYGLMATTPGWITIFPDRSITKKPLETRMGSGKGSPEEWVAAVKPGRVMFELSGVPEELAREAMRKASHKLPVQTKFVLREEGGE